MINFIKIVGIGIITLIFVIILKENKKDFAIYISLLGGIFILYFSVKYLEELINFITEISNKFDIQTDFIKLLFKITGISILAEVAISICKDSGESGIASKIDLGGKLIVITLTIPVIGNSLEGLLSLLS